MDFFFKLEVGLINSECAQYEHLKYIIYSNILKF